MAKKVKLAHLINAFDPPSGSEFEYVQPITFESMRVAKAQSPVPVDLLAATTPEDHSIVPNYFQFTKDLDRTVRDVLGDNSVPPMPLIADLIERLHASTDADYLIYTNVDIAVQPHFYTEVAKAIEAGNQAFIINRRRIPGHFRTIEELPEMYAATGKKHPGFDCFVFHRSLFPRIQLGHVCIGIPFIGILMAQNMFCYGEPFQLFEGAQLTFHVGEEVFKKRNQVLWKHNQREFWGAIGKMWNDLDSRKWPYGRQWMPLRLVRWGLHPSLPIRLALKLELKRWGLR